jgi:hypothetical protein
MSMALECAFVSANIFLKSIISAAAEDAATGLLVSFSSASRKLWFWS